MTGESEPEFARSLSRALSLEFTPREPEYFAYPRILSTSHGDSTQMSSDIDCPRPRIAEVDILLYEIYCMKFKCLRAVQSLKQVRDDDEGTMEVRYVPVTATSVTSTFHVLQA